MTRGNMKRGSDPRSDIRQASLNPPACRSYRPLTLIFVNCSFTHNGLSAILGP